MKYPLLKNIACGSITITCILISCLLVVNLYLSNNVTSSINSIATLTGGNQRVWGMYPGYNKIPLNKTIQFLSLDMQDQTLTTMPPYMDCSQNVNLIQSPAYSYNNFITYKNVSLQQGSGGYVTYYKNESLVEDNQASIEISEQNILNMFNEGLLQGYYEEIYSPIARKMPLYLYNLKQQMMDSLATYFARMMQVFNIGSKSYTQTAVFTPLNIPEDMQEQLWNDANFGWGNQVTLGKWVRIVLSTQYANNQDFGIIQTYFGLSTDVMTGLAGKSSMLNKLSWLINGTLADSVIQYGGSACEELGIFCSNSELVSSQWAQGILTTSDIFLYNKNMQNFTFNDLNATIPINAELGLFAPSPINANDGMNLLSINATSGDMWNPMATGKSITLISYYNMAQLYNNKNNAGIINFNLKLYDVSKVGPLISYLDNMEQNLILKNDVYPGLGNQQTVTTAWFMFRGFNTVFNTIGDLAISNLFARAMYNLLKFNTKKCSDLFTDPTLASMLPICTSRGLQQFNPLNSYLANIPFAFAFIGNQNSDDFLNLLDELQIPQYELSYFLYNTKKSLFAQYLDQIQKDLKTFYGCLSYCTARELGRKQWMNSGVTNNLPPAPYFLQTDQASSIQSWDKQNELTNNLIPEINLYVQAINQQVVVFSELAMANLLDTSTGSILTWSSLHEFILLNNSQNQGQLSTIFGLSLQDSTAVLNYLQHVVIEQIFGGVYLQLPASEMMWGYVDEFLIEKAGWKQIDGGQPWINTKRSILKRDNYQQAANLQPNQVYWVNTGIEDISGVNNIEKILGSTTIAVNYNVWSQDSTFANSIQSPIYPYNLNQTVQGSNGFAFNTKIDSDSQLTWINEKYSRINNLTLVEQTEFLNQKVNKYVYTSSSQTQQTFGDNLSGTLNMTGSAFNSLYISNLYFQGTNLPEYTNQIQLNGNQFSGIPNSQSISSETTNSYLLVEPLSGQTVQIALNEQHNLLLQQGFIFDPYHLKGQCLLPTYWDIYGMQYSSELVSSQFSSLNSDSSSQNTALITFIVLTSVSFAVSVIFIIFAVRQRKKFYFQLHQEAQNGLRQPLNNNTNNNNNFDLSENNYASSVQRTFNNQNAASMISARVVHRFLRNPNLETGPFQRAGTRFDPFKNTLTVLTDPQNGRTLYLIGTTNSSTQLANRTKALIAKEKPDAVFVQTSKEWWDIASSIEGVNCQQELNRYNSLLSSAFSWEMDNTIRSLIFKAKFYSWLFVINWFKAFPSDFHPFIPGLEMKYAIEEANKLKVPVVLAGLEIDDITLNSLKTEPRMDPFSQFFYGNRALHNSFWRREYADTYETLDVVGSEAYAESMDRSRTNWFVKYFEKLAPYQKKVIVDQKDVDLFYALYRDTPGKKVVAVVNQWHMPGIEEHWRSATKTQPALKPINPIGDFDINKYMESQLVNDTLRAFVSKIGKTEPASWKNYSTMYHKDNYEAERVRHVSFLSHDDPHMNHGLPQDYDNDMKPKHH